MLCLSPCHFFDIFYFGCFLQNTVVVSDMNYSPLGPEMHSFCSSIWLRQFERNQQSIPKHCATEIVQTASCSLLHELTHFLANDARLVVLMDTCVRGGIYFRCLRVPSFLESPGHAFCVRIRILWWHLDFFKYVPFYFSFPINWFMKWFPEVDKYITYVQCIYVLQFSLLTNGDIDVNSTNWS